MERMKKEVIVSKRYNSRIGQMFALEDAMEMEALRKSGILESVESTLKPDSKVGCAVYIGTSGDLAEIEKVNEMFKNE